MVSVAGRYAARSVTRNIRRSALSVAGIAIGCVLALLMESMNRGRDELFARACAYSGSGHIRIVAAGWRNRRDVPLRLADWTQDAAAARALPNTAAVAPRARAEVLLAMGTRVIATEMVGVDPVSEPSVDRFIRTVQAGRYLRPGDRGAIVIGQAIADRLSASVDDDVLATVVGAGGEIESAMFRVAGIVRTGADDVELMICHVPLSDLERFSGFAGAGEVAVIVADWRRTAENRSMLAGRLAGGDEAMTCEEISPDFKGHMAQDQRASRVISGIILLIVLLGVTSAQLAAVLERRREFAVFAALGMPAKTMVRLLLLEATAIGAAGGLVGLAVGAPLVWWFATSGLDFSRVGSNMSFSGTLVEPIIYGDFGAWIVPYVFVVALVATVLASLYPARFAVRTDPAAALRVAQ